MTSFDLNGWSWQV